jgi:hypothetical protein
MVDKYIPNDMNDILFDDSIIKNITEWLSSYGNVKGDYFKNNKASDSKTNVYKQYW